MRKRQAPQGSNRKTASSSARPRRRTVAAAPSVPRRRKPKVVPPVVVASHVVDAAPSAPSDPGESAAVLASAAAARDVVAAVATAGEHALAGLASFWQVLAQRGNAETPAAIVRTLADVAATGLADGVRVAERLMAHDAALRRAELAALGSVVTLGLGGVERSLGALANAAGVTAASAAGDERVV